MLDPARSPTAYSHGYTQSERRHPQPELGGAAATELLRLAELIRGAGSVVALTGAGISVPSGIPDFRSPGTGLLLCIGSSLEVYPVAGLPRLTHAAGGAVAILTQGPTPLDDLAQVRLSGEVVEELEALTATLLTG